MCTDRRDNGWSGVGMMHGSLRLVPGKTYRGMGRIADQENRFAYALFWGNSGIRDVAG
jgi:hypothetical protein